MKKLLYLLMICGVFACSKKDNEPPTSQEPAAVTEISAYLAAADSLTEFGIAFKKIAISAADAAGGLTIFAPGNESIGSYDLGGRTMGKDLPDSIIKNHIVKGMLKAADLTDGKKLTTLSGKELTVKVVDGKIYVNGILISFADGKAGSQVVHTIAGILAESTGGTDITVYDATKWSESQRNGQLAEGATVNLYLTADEYLHQAPHYTATTNASGVAHFTGIAPGSYFAVVTKGELSNTWPDANGHTYVSLDTLYQSVEELVDAHVIATKDLGDIRFADLNQNEYVEEGDKTTAPARVVTVKSDEINAQKILIGYEVNSQMKLLTTLDQAQDFLNYATEQIGVVQKTLVVIDGIMSDDADCADFPDWCNYDQFNITASDNRIAEIWVSQYASIQKLNKIILSLSSSMGDTTAIAAQARGLRAYAYLQLATYFGGLPYYRGLAIPTNINRSTLADTYAFIRQDLQIALSGLPVTSSERKLTKGAAKALLARIALYNNDFVTAKSYADDVIQSGTYSLSAASDIFLDSNGPEIVWDAFQTSPYYFPQYWGTRICPVVRLPELYLISAEANVALGNTTAAKQSINVIRNRSSMPLLSTNTPDEIRAALVDTYQKEYLKEGYRFISLVRWNMAQQVLGSKGYNQYNNLLPVSIKFVQDYPNMVQNPGF
jgi:uncharacterized surface protein with fasciclin (FAS1) repeats